MNIILFFCRDAQTDMFDLLTESEQVARKKLENIIMEGLLMPKSADPGKLLLMNITEKSSYNLCKSDHKN